MPVLQCFVEFTSEADWPRVVFLGGFSVTDSISFVFKGLLMASVSH